MLWTFLMGIVSLSFAYVDVSDFNKSTAGYKALVFLSKDCPCSRSHVPHLNQLSTQFKNVDFYGVITDSISKSNAHEIDSYFNSDQISFPVIKDSEQQLVKQYNALKTPHITLLKKQKNGYYTTIYEGGVSDHREFSQAHTYFLKENLKAIEAGSPVPFSNGKSLGCYIRRFL